MNSETTNERSVLPALIGIVGALLIVLILIWAMRQYMEPSPLNKFHQLDHLANELRTTK